MVIISPEGVVPGRIRARRVSWYSGCSPYSSRMDTATVSCSGCWGAWSSSGWKCSWYGCSWSAVRGR